MGKFKSFLSSQYQIVSMVFVSVLARILLSVNGGKSLFDSGQDAPTYEQAALDFSQYGWFSSKIFSLPYWPAGYPYFLSFFIELSSNHWQLLVVLFQHSLFILSVLILSQSLIGLVGKKISTLAASILLFIPAFLYAPSENMYEPLLTSFIMLGVACALRLSSSSSTNFGLLVLGMVICFGSANFIQAKTAPIGLISIFIALWHKKGTAVIVSLMSLWGSGLLILRSWIAYSILSPSTNFGKAIQAGGLDIDCQLRTGQLATGAKLEALVDSHYTSCAFEYFLSHPINFLEHILTQARALYGPLDGGGIPSSSTWIHGLQFRRFAELSDQLSTQQINAIVWLGAIVLNCIIVFGFYASLRFYDIKQVALISSPIMFISIIQFISHGDSRYRLPFLPFQIIFLLLGLFGIQAKFGEWISKKQKSAEK
jgi:hypothetical protein